MAISSGKFKTQNEKEEVIGVGDKCDLTSANFDPLACLYAENVIIPCPEVHPVDNVAKLESLLSEKPKTAEKNKKENPPNENSKEECEVSVDTENLTPMQKLRALRQGKTTIFDTSQECSKEKLKIEARKGRLRVHRNVLTTMNDISQGPLHLLKRSVEGRYIIRVWTRSAADIRGYCTGYLVAFDKYFNLAMIDVDETFKKATDRDRRHWRKKKVDSKGDNSNTQEPTAPCKVDNSGCKSNSVDTQEPLVRDINTQNEKKEEEKWQGPTGALDSVQGSNRLSANALHSEMASGSHSAGHDIGDVAEVTEAMHRQCSLDKDKDDKPLTQGLWGGDQGHSEGSQGHSKNSQGHSESGQGHSGGIQGHGVDSIDTVQGYIDSQGDSLPQNHYKCQGHTVTQGHCTSQGQCASNSQHLPQLPPTNVLATAQGQTACQGHTEVIGSQKGKVMEEKVWSVLSPDHIHPPLEACGKLKRRHVNQLFIRGDNVVSVGIVHF